MKLYTKLYTLLALSALGLSAQTYTVGSATIPSGTLWMLNSSSLAIPLTAGASYAGIAQAAVTSGNPITVVNSGTLNCLVENATTSGDLLIQGTTNANQCRDSGATAPSGVASGTRIYGTASASVSAGNLAAMALYANTVYGTQAASSGGGSSCSGDINSGCSTVTKTGGVAFAPSATTDATNASNISSGTLGASRLPNPSASTLGGVQSAAAASHQFINSISTSGVPALSQPAAGDVSGLATSATTDTTNASNISSGTVSTARLPVIPYSLGGCNSTTSWTQGSILFAGSSACSQSNANLWFTPTTLGTATTPTATVNGTSGSTTYRWVVEPVNSIGYGHGIASAFVQTNTGPALLNGTNNVSINFVCGSQPTGTLFEVFRSVDGSGVTHQGGPLLNSGGASIYTVACPGSFVDTGLTPLGSPGYIGDTSASSAIPDTSAGSALNNLSILGNLQIGNGIGPAVLDIWPGASQTGQTNNEPLRLRDNSGNIVGWWQPANSIWALQGELEFANYPGGTGQQTMYLSNGGGINMGNGMFVSWSPTLTQPSVSDTKLCRGGVAIVEFGNSACNSSGEWLAAAGAGTGTATFAANANAGTGATAACKSSHICDSISGTVTLTTGTSPASGTQFTVTTTTTRTNKPNCSVRFYGVAGTETDPTETTTTFVAAVSSALTASTAYTVHYDCWGN